MNEDYVSFETAKLLKDKKFDETCRTFYKSWNNETNLCDCNSSHCFEYCSNSMLENYNDKDELNIAAPTLQMAMKWLREVHYITIGITFSLDIIFYEIQKDKKVIIAIGSSRSYEDMVEEAIKYCLEKLI